MDHDTITDPVLAPPSDREPVITRVEIIATGAPMTGKNITRLDLYNAVYKKTGLSRSESLVMVELVLKEITDTLERGETVKLSAFGQFIVRTKKERLGRNPKTGAKATVSRRQVVVFKPSAVLKQQINGSPSGIKTSTIAELGSSVLLRTRSANFRS
jgi:integration host factor subunit alpha